MHFFRFREDANRWIEGRQGITILSMPEANELAQWHRVERPRRAESCVHPRAIALLALGRLDLSAQSLLFVLIER